MFNSRSIVAALAALAAVLTSTAASIAQTYSNSTPITIPASGAATPYPSVIIASGAPTSINYVTVTLNGFAHTFPADVQVLLVAPNGQKTMLMSGVGGSIDVSGVNLTFAPDSANTLGARQLFPGTYRPRNVSPNNLPAPAPAGSYTADLTVFNGLNANGTWSLFVNDVATPDGGSIDGGWSISFNSTVRQPLPVSTAFTYQGRLEGVPANSTATMRFSLWDHPNSTDLTNRVSSILTQTVTVDANNTFTTALDFGTSIQRQRALFLQIEVSAGGSPVTILSPRQPLTGAPLALQLRGVTVDSANQVGVGGIEDPQFVFETNGRMRVRGDAGTTSLSPPGIWFSSPSPAGAQTNRGLVGVRDDSNVGFFITNWHLLVNANGNINIGDPSGAAPPERLSVTGNIQLNTPGRLSFGPVGNLGGSAENSDAVYFQRASGGNDVSILRLNLGDNSGATATDVFTITTSTDGTTFSERFRFQSDGNAFKPGGGSWSTLSDASTKDNITPLVGTLDRLLNIHGYSFTYKPQFIADGRALPGTQFGLVAQDVQRVFPDWVRAGPDGKLFVTERATTALMVEALRDLRAEKDKQLDALRAEKDQQLRALQDQNAELTRRLDALERALNTPRK